MNNLRHSDDRRLTTNRAIRLAAFAALTVAGIVGANTLLFAMLDAVVGAMYR